MRLALRHRPSYLLSARFLVRVVPLARSLLPLLALPLLALAACGQSYSPDTYATRAVQQANRAERGVIVGVRRVEIQADGTTGATAGAAAGAAAGSQIGQGGLANAFSAIGGGVLGGLLGTATERAAGDTNGFEYIVRKDNKEKDLVSVVQKDEKPLAIGQRVLVISGNQARIVPDYTTDPPEAPQSASESAAGRAVTPANPAPSPATGTPPATEGSAPAGSPAPATEAPPATDLAPPAEQPSAEQPAASPSPATPSSLMRQAIERQISL